MYLKVKINFSNNFYMDFEKLENFREKLNEKF